jgi:cell division protein FtsB
MARRTMLTTRATLLAVVICVLVLTFTYPLRLFLTQREEITELSTQNAERQHRVDELRRAAARYDDPAWVADEARRRLHYLRPGEQAYLMPDDAAPPAPRRAGADDGGEGAAWYGQLWTQLAGTGAEAGPAPGAQTGEARPAASPGP